MTTSATRQSKKQQYDPNKGYEELAQSLIELMEKGVNPFRRSWTREAQHTNFVTGEEYQNGNLICLEIARITRNYKSPYWMGFGQAKKYGLKMIKGSKICGVSDEETLKYILDLHLINQTIDILLG